VSSWYEPAAAAAAARAGEREWWLVW
jgi:hypothetical protein